MAQATGERLRGPEESFTLLAYNAAVCFSPLFFPTVPFYEEDSVGIVTVVLLVRLVFLIGKDFDEVTVVADGQSLNLCAVDEQGLLIGVAKQGPARPSTACPNKHRQKQHEKNQPNPSVYQHCPLFGRCSSKHRCRYSR
jgi:hypothetical protein